MADITITDIGVTIDRASGGSLVLRPGYATHLPSTPFEFEHTPPEPFSDANDLIEDALNNQYFEERILGWTN
jgi:hypothetical protein